jgi:hypothetical protein
VALAELGMAEVGAGDAAPVTVLPATQPGHCTSTDSAHAVDGTKAGAPGSGAAGAAP